MPRIKPLLPEERMRREFFGTIKKHAEQFGLTTDKEIAELLGISPQLYSIRKKSMEKWNAVDMAGVFNKLHFSGDEIAEIYKKGMRV